MIKNCEKKLEDNKYIELIQQPDLKRILLNVLEKNSKIELIKDCNNVCEWMLFLMEDEKLIQKDVKSPYLDLMIFSAFIHNISFKYGKSKWNEVFALREKLNEDEDFMSMPESYRNGILQSVEQQLGKHVPVDLIHPISNTPSYQFAKACSIYYNKARK